MRSIYVRRKRVWWCAKAIRLTMLGYGPIIGIGLSDSMLQIARSKHLYSELKQAVLGEALEFSDQHFSGIISSGTITPKHAPPHAFNELIRVAKRNALIVFSMRDDDLQEPAYPAMLRELENDGKWESVFTGDHFFRCLMVNLRSSIGFMFTEPCKNESAWSVMSLSLTVPFNLMAKVIPIVM